MRDPKRIDKFCNMLKAYLYTGDDRRAMQLVCNLQNGLEAMASIWETIRQWN